MSATNNPAAPDPEAADEEPDVDAEDVREQNGLVIHLLREIEGQLDGVEIDTSEGDSPKDVDDLL